MGRNCTVVLVETAVAGRPGSMIHYGDLAKKAVERQKILPFRVRRVNISLSVRLPAWLPGRLKYALELASMSLKAKKLASEKADLFHLIDGSHAHVIRWWANRKTVCTSHDLIPHLQCQVRFPVPAPGLPARWLMRRSLASLMTASRVVAVSRSTADDLIAAGMEEKRLSVVHSAIPAEIARAVTTDPGGPWEKRRYADGAFVFHVGNNSFYKNRKGVLRIFARFGRKFGLRLCMAGPAPSKELVEWVGRLGLRKRVDFIVDPDARTLAGLYRQACLLLFPSLYEGFGWPPLEAMAFGCPVVCSNAEALAEVAGPAALTADAEKESDMAMLCRRVLSEPGLAGSLIKKGRDRIENFSLERMGRGLASAYQQAIDNS
jgi:glycosyltransferase involved in cell wall biosynthesis